MNDLPNMNDLLEERLELVRQKNVLEKAVGERLDAIKEEMQLIDNKFLDFLNSTGQTSIKTDAGTISIREHVSVTIADSNQFFDWIVETGNWDAVQKRASSTVVKSLLNDGQEVPGISLYRVNKISVRKT